MSSTYEGIKLDFEVDVSKLKQNLQDSLDEVTLKIKNISATAKAIDDFKDIISNRIKDKPLDIKNINATPTGVRLLKESIDEEISKKPLKISNLTVGPIDLKNITTKNDNSLRSKIRTSINEGVYSIEISSVDASKAIASIRKQLTTALNEAGFTGGKGAIATQANVVAKAQERAQKKLSKNDAVSSLERSAKEEFRKAAEGKDKITEPRSIQKIATLYNEIAESATKAHEASHKMNEEAFAKNELTPLKRKIDLLRESIELTKKLQALNEQPVFFDTGVSAVQDLNISGNKEKLAAIEEANKLMSSKAVTRLQDYANQTKNSITSGANALTDISVLQRLDKAWEEIEAEIIRVSEVSRTANDPALIEAEKAGLQKLCDEYSLIVTKLKEMKALKVDPVFSSGAGSSLGGLNSVDLDAQLKSAQDVSTAMKEFRKVWDGATKDTTSKKNIKSSENYEALQVQMQKLIGLETEYYAAANPAKKQQIAASILKEADAMATLVREEQLAVQEANKLTTAEANRIAKSNATADLKSVTTLAEQLQRFVTANSKLGQDNRTKDMYSGLLADLEKLKAGMRSGGTGGATNVLNGELEQIRLNMKAAKVAANELGLASKTMFERMTGAFSKFGGWMMVTSALMEIVNLIHKATENVFELDAAMTELRKVTDETESTYSRFFENAEKRSKVIGASLVDTVTATADFARQGYNLVDAQGLAEAALVYKNVGDNIESIDEASQSIISTMKAFYNTADSGMSKTQEAMSIVDMFNEVSNNFAVSSDGLGASMQRSASALAAGNNSLQESLAMTTAINEVLQDPEKTGTVLKTLSMYLRSAKTEAQDANIETEGMAHSVAKLRDQILTLTNQRVDIMANPTTLKSTYQVYKELSEVYDSMSDIDSANLLELLGGSELCPAA